MSTPPASKTKEPRGSGARRREDILESARDLFYVRGFETGSMREIAQTLNITQAALYYHFTSKDEILYSILQLFTDHVHVVISESLSASPPRLEHLYATIRTHVVLSRDYVKDVKLLLEDRKLLGEPYAARIREREREIFDLYRNYVAALVAGGELKKVSSAVVTFTLLSVINNLHQWYRPKGDLSIEEVADTIVSVFGQGWEPGGRASA